MWWKHDPTEGMTNEQRGEACFRRWYYVLLAGAVAVLVSLMLR